MIYEAKNIRNVALFGHQGSGKTSLVESLYAAVNGTEKGSIEKGNTISDYHLFLHQSYLFFIRITKLTY